MSLFDVLRYPVSLPPKPDELRVLPCDLFLKWKEDIGFLCIASPEAICDFYTEYASIRTITNDINTLREMIKRLP